MTLVKCSAEIVDCSPQQPPLMTLMSVLSAWREHVL